MKHVFCLIIYLFVMGYSAQAQIPVGVIGSASTPAEIEAAKMAFEQQKWEDQKEIESTRTWLAFIGGLLALATIIVGIWRNYMYQQQVKEQMLTSFRERLFSEEHSAIISAAMSLSKYPHEAVWLVNRWAEINRRINKMEENDKEHFINRIKELSIVRQAIQDALFDMGDKWTWINPIEIWIKKHIFKKEINIPKLRYPRVRGPRLDNRSITIHIGNIKLKYAYISNSKFNGIDLSGAKLEKAYISHSKFNGSNLNRIAIDSATIIYSDFMSSNLSKACILKTKIDHSYINNANLSNINIHASTIISSVLNSSTISNSKIKNCSFDDCRMIDISIDHSEITSSKLENSDLEGSSLIDCDLLCTSFKSSKLESVNLSFSKLIRTNFFDTTLDEADIEGILNWKRIESFQDSGLIDVKNAPRGFIRWASKRGAVVNVIDYENDVDIEEMTGEV